MAGLSGTLRYCVDLGGLQSQCDQNYWRLKRLLASLMAGESSYRWPQQGREAELRVQVTDQSRYTATLEIDLSTFILPWYPRQNMKVRLYHDVRMAEVIEFQSHRHIPARNRFPNEKAFVPDEKSQVNAFLGDCLRHCLRDGYVVAEPLSYRGVDPAETEN